MLVRMIEVEEAVGRILAEVRAALPAESMPLAEAAGRVARGAVAAPLDLPPFDNSAMDGYAVRAADVSGASAERPVALAVIGRCAAGEWFSGALGAGQAVRVFTGAPLPAGADAVVMQEDTRGEDAPGAQVAVLDPVKPWENVRFRGEDVRAGETVLGGGEVLTVGQVSLLAALGFGGVTVSRRPRVGLLATGDELREAGEPLAPGQIHESNRAGLAVLARQSGAVPAAYPLVPDDPAATARALERALEECDLVVSTGGVSVGETDFVKQAFASLGGRADFWRVRIKPGKPVTFGARGGKLFFGLPGNPVSALVGFTVFVAPALRALQGARETSGAGLVAELAGPLANHGDRRHFVRVRFDAAGRVAAAGAQASHLLKAVAAADGLVDVPPETVLAAGTKVRVIRWG
jgi:molybdopterin molybdotransferase